MLLQEFFEFINTEPGAPAGIDAAFAHLAKGETGAAESVFY